MKTLLLAAGLSMITAGTPLARDIWTGDYSGDCGNDKIQCAIEINSGETKSVKVSFVVADRLDYSRVLCRIDSTFQKTRPNTLAAEIPNVGNVSIRAVSDGLIVSGIAKKSCKVKLDGTYYFIGD